MLVMTVMYIRVIEWYMAIPQDMVSTEAAAFVSVVTGAMTGAGDDDGEEQEAEVENANPHTNTDAGGTEISAPSSPLVPISPLSPIAAINIYIISTPIVTPD